MARAISYEDALRYVVVNDPGENRETSWWDTWEEDDYKPVVYLLAAVYGQRPGEVEDDLERTRHFS